jgi:hypothetical protein
MLEYRREFYADTAFFSMPEYWERITVQSEGWSIKAYKSNEIEDYKRKAGTVSLGDKVTLVADERLMVKAKQGCRLANFILAHEVGHLALDHHAQGAVIKNFQLFASPSGMSNIPPTLEELEANFAAVFFQCGPALFDPSLRAVDLARRASSDIHYVKKAQGVVRLTIFQEQLRRPKSSHERVVF